VGRIHEPGGYAPHQEPTTAAEPPGPDHDEVLGIPVQVIEERLEHLAVKGHGLNDLRPMGKRLSAKVLEHRDEGKSVIQRNEGVQTSGRLVGRRRTYDCDRERSGKTPGNLARDLDGPTGVGGTVEPHEDSLEHSAFENRQPQGED